MTVVIMNLLLCGLHGELDAVFSLEKHAGDECGQAAGSGGAAGDDRGGCETDGTHGRPPG